MNTKPDTQISAALKTALEANSASATPPAETGNTSASPEVGVRVAAKTVVTPAAKTATPAKTIAAKPAAKTTVAAAKPATKPAEKAADADFVGNLIAGAAAGSAPVKAQVHNLPDCLQVKPYDGDPLAEVIPKDTVRLEVWGSGCLSCSALISNDPDLEPLEELPKCHFSRGQKGCPAQSVQITIVGPLRRAVSQLQAARDAKDVARMLRLLNALGDKDASFQEEVLREAGMLDQSAEGKVNLA